jgi:dienelactone hydrolase
MKNLLSFALILSTFSIFSQEFEGDWTGKILVQGFPLTLDYHISKNENGFTATMDSPDQKSYGNKVKEVIVNGYEINLNFPEYKIFTKLNYKNDSLIGNYVQLGKNYPMSLSRKTGESKAINRPQEPKAPFDYQIEEVKFKNTKEKITLAGTLTYPNGAGPFPTVILISGSGGQNRDEELFNHKPFWVIADYFAKNGIATLRYDDRGIAQSEGNFAASTSEDFAEDAKAGIEFLKKHSKVNTSRLGIVGHSEGGIIAPMVAAADSSVGFIILLAGPGIPIDELMILQNNEVSKAAGLAESIIKENAVLNQKCYAIIKTEKDLTKTKSKLRKLLSKNKMSELDIQNTINLVCSPWFRYFIQYDPKISLEKVKCPVLAVNGDKDIQVIAKENLAGIEAALKKAGNQNYEVKLVENKNHLFQTTEKLGIDEYFENEETFAPDVLKLMLDWINKIK